jgi:4-oxalmesaconate hydratase
MCELDVPGMIHSSTCLSSRLNYTLHFINEESIALVSLINSKVFEHFPKLKIVCAHGGGAIPYQMGRFMAGRYQSRRDMARKAVDPEHYFENVAKKVFYDTCLYSAEGLELLFKVIGPANCCFGTEAPGAGSSVNPHSGKAMDDLRPIIEGFSWLSDGDKKSIFEGNARKLYRL